ncbi:MAG TPA: hypothetical protein VH437_15300 [Terriglobales bacterium]
MRSPKRLAVLLPVFLVFLPGCGGGSSSSGGGGMVGGGGGGTLNAAIPVDVTAGLDTAGVAITAVSPVSSPAPNATTIGLGTSAANTGTTISRGSTQTVLLFGPGLSGSMQVSLTGPADVAISNIQSITATDNTPGVSFTAAVDGNAALGARTVILQNSNNDVTTFSGGLEII